MKFWKEWDPAKHTYVNIGSGIIIGQVWNNDREVFMCHITNTREEGIYIRKFASEQEAKDFIDKFIKE